MCFVEYDDGVFEDDLEINESILLKEKVVREDDYVCFVFYFPRIVIRTEFSTRSR